MDRLLAVEDVAELLGVPKTTLYRWRYLGSGPRGITVGRHVRYRAIDVEHWVDAQEANERKRRP
jgi:excisionase family DNA binding protein